MSVRSGAAGGGGGSPSTVALTSASSLTQTVNATSADGFLLANTTAAAAGAQQWSPRFHWQGNGWKTTATAASQSVDWIAEVQPVQGTTAPTSNWVLSSSINGGAYTNQVQITSAGAVTLAGSIFSTGTISSTNGDISTGGNINFGANGFGRKITATSAGTIENTSSGVIGITGIVQIGASNVAAPAAQTLRAYGSRAGTDTNTGGASLTLRAGAGTGTGTLSSLIFQTPVAVASGTGAQTMTTGLTIKNGVAISPDYTVATLPTASTVPYGRCFVSDALTTLTLGIGTTVAGGGANKTPVWSDGTNWIYG